MGNYLSILVSQDKSHIAPIHDMEVVDPYDVVEGI
jgi:hypothetical protein